MVSRRGGQRVAPRRAPAGFIRYPRAIPYAAPPAMGCTASTPNTIPINGNNSDKNIQFIEETIEIPSETIATVQAVVESKIEMESNVLPSSCDNIAETVQLSNVNHSQAHLENEKEIQVNGHVDNIEPEPDKFEPEQTEVDIEKIPKLEKLIDKVFEINPMLINMNTETESSKEDGETVKNPDENTDVKENSDAEKKIQNNDAEAVKDNETNETLEIDANVDDTEGTPGEESPSTSEFSRATRWEALADIVAELPPSLAIDPITGQIYSLTK